MRALALLALAACSSRAAPPTTPIDTASQALVGTWRIRSTVDVPFELLLPQSGEAGLSALRAFVWSPGMAIVTLAGGDDLPASIRDKVAGWIDAELAKHPARHGSLAKTVALELIGAIESTLARFELAGTLVVEPAAATHAITQLRIDSYGHAFPMKRRLPATPTATSLTLGDHAFGVAYGKLAWKSLGVDPYNVLANTVQCPVLAGAVAANKIGPVAVGHAAEIAAVCDRALVEIAARTRRTVEALRFDVLRFARGTAKTNSALEFYGTWEIELDSGQGPRPTKGVFKVERAL